MNVDIHGAPIYFEIPILGGIKISAWISRLYLLLALVMLVLTLVCIFLTHGMKVNNISKRQAIAEKIVLTAENFVRSNMGEAWMAWTPFISAIFALSIFSSLASLIGLWSPTADVSTTLAWALVVFVIMTYFKLKTNGLGGYLKGFCDPIFLMAPFNVLGEVFTPISMAFRHFGNIVSGTVISTLFAVVVAGGCYFLGGFARLFPAPDVLPNGRLAYDSIIPTMLSANLPAALMALVLLLVLSASMSTLASLVLTSSSTMTLDLIYRDKQSREDEVSQGKINAEVAAKIERRKVVVMRVLIVFFIVISLMIALNPPQFIAQLMGISWGALAGAFLAPFMLGLYWRGVTKMAVWACFAWGVGLTLINMLLGNPVNPINCGALAMLGGFAVVAGVSLVTPKPSAAFLDGIFACYAK